MPNVVLFAKLVLRLLFMFVTCSLGFGDFMVCDVCVYVCYCALNTGWFACWWVGLLVCFLFDIVGVLF